MSLSKKNLLKLIQEERNFMAYLEKDKEDIKNGKYKNESIESQRIESCSNDIGFIVHEAKLEVLNKIMNDFYKPKKRQPTKLEFLTEILAYMEKRTENNNSHHRYITEWKFFTIKEIKEKIEKLKNIKQQRKEVLA